MVSNNRAATCYKCGGPNHYARDCQAQAMKCYACGKLVRLLCSCSKTFVAHDTRAIFPETAPRQMGGLSILLAKFAISVAKRATFLAIAHLWKQTASQRPRPPLRHLQRQQRTLMRHQLSHLLLRLLLWPNTPVSLTPNDFLFVHFYFSVTASDLCQSHYD